MTDYKELYFMLYRKVSLAISALPENELAALILKEAQQQCEELREKDT